MSHQTSFLRVIELLGCIRCQSKHCRDAMAAIAATLRASGARRIVLKHADIASAHEARTCNRGAMRLAARVASLNGVLLVCSALSA